MFLESVAQYGIGNGGAADLIGQGELIQAYDVAFLLFRLSTAGRLNFVQGLDARPIQ